MLALKAPTARLMVEMKKERLYALVRLESVAMSASMAPHEEAYIASESPPTTTAPKRIANPIELVAGTIPKIAILTPASTPPAITNFFLPCRSANLPKTRDDPALVAPNAVNIRPEVARLTPWSRRKTCIVLKKRPGATQLKKLEMFSRFASWDKPL